MLATHEMALAAQWYSCTLQSRVSSAILINTLDHLYDIRQVFPIRLIPLFSCLREITLEDRRPSIMLFLGDLRINAS